MINPNIILLFDGNNADIPDGFTRETTLDGKFPKAWGSEDPDTTGGSANHTHSSPNHNHSLSNHSHSGRTELAWRGSDHATGGTGGPLSEDHYHNYNFSGRSGGSTNNTAVTYGSVSNNPPYYEVIFIKSDGYNFIPNSGMVLKEGSTRSGLTFHSASAGKYLKGASAGSNAGGTGGSTTNVHNIDHTHSTNSHTHSGTTGNSVQTGTRWNAGDGSTAVGRYHTHSLTLTASTQGINSYSGSLTTTETVEPAYKTLNAFKNNSGNNILPQPGDIAMFLGSTDNLPTGWNLCNGDNGTPDMRNKFLKINSSAGSSTTGGSNTHTHATQSHSHSSSGNHTHNQSISDHSGNKQLSGNYDNVAIPSLQHVKGGETCTTVQANYDSANTTANESNNEPEYRTVAYIQMEFSVAGGGGIIPRFMF